MTNNFRQEKAEQTGAAGLASQVASVVVMLSLCYAAMPAFAGAGDTLLSGACSFLESESAAPADVLTPVAAKTIAPAFKFAPVQDSTATLPMVSPSMPDRHWCIAEAFNAALDQKTQQVPLRAAAATIRQPVYTGYCRVPANGTSLKTAAIPSRSLRQCQAVRT